MTETANTVVDLLRDGASSDNRGSRQLLRDGSWTGHPYAVLWERSGRVAAALRRRGFGNGSPLAAAVDDPGGFLVLLWACLRAGVPIAPMPALQGTDPEALAARRLAGCAALLETPVLCVGSQQAERISAAGAAPAGTVTLRELEAEAGEAELPTPDPSDLAVVHFSSGTTRAPKGVRLTHANIVANIRDKIAAEAIDDRCRMASWFPYYHDFGLFGAHLTAVAAGIDEVHLEPRDFARAPLCFLKAISDHGATHAYCTASAARVLVRLLGANPARAEGIDLSCLDLFCLGAEFVPAALCEDVAGSLATIGMAPGTLRIGYGLAEAVLVVAGRSWKAPVVPLRVEREALFARGRAVPASDGHADTLDLVDAGLPLATCSIAIRDDQDRDLPPMHVGRINISGPNVTDGYIGDAEATAAAIRGEWLDTGDLGFVTDEGLLVPVGRAKDMIVANGGSQPPDDVEEIARRAACDAWSEVAAVAHIDAAIRGESLVLFFVPRAGAGQDGSRLVQVVGTAVTKATGLTVNAFVKLANREMPRTSSGKLARHVLRKDLVAGAFRGRMIEAGKIDMDEDPVQALTDARLAAIRGAWMEALELQGAAQDTNDDFFALGGDSIRALRLLAELERIAGGKLPIDFVYVHPTIGAQSEAIAARGDGLCRTDLEVLVRDMAADAFGVDPATLSPDEQLMARAGGLEAVLTFAEEAKRVFDDPPAVDRALSKNTVRDIAACLAVLGPDTAENDGDLMPFQETLYYHRRSVMRNEPTGLSCYIVYRFDLLGELDVDLLGDALDALVDVHPMLRVWVDESGERPKLKLSPTLKRLPLHVECIKHLPPDERAARLVKIDREDDDYRADLGQAPLFYIRAIERGDRRWTITMHFDHMVVDGFGLLELSKELFETYEAKRLGRPLPKFDSAPAFSSYVWLQGLRVRTSRYAADIEHHLAGFANLPPRLMIPMRRNPATLDAVTFATLHRAPDRDLLAGLRAWTQADSSLSLNSILLAALFKVANVWSGQDDLVLNMPIFNREHYLPDARRVCGSFIDIFPVRLTTSFAEPIAAMARRLETSIRDLLARPVSSIELSRRIAEREGVRGAMSSIIFSNSMNLVRPSDLALETLDHEMAPRVRTGAPGTWIDLVLYSVGDDWHLDWNYVRDLFDESFIETLAEQYEAILEDGVAAWRKGEAGEAFSSAAALPEKHKRLLAEINDTAGPVAELTLHAEVARRAAEFPDGEALTFAGERLSYRDLIAAANRLAHALRESGIGPDRFVAISLPRSIDLIVAQLGTLVAGGAYVPIDPSYPADRIGYMIEDSGARVLIAASEAAGDLDAAHLNAVERAILFGDAASDARLPDRIETLGARELGCYPEDAPEDTAMPSDLAYMIYTSGSTGRPKGVMIPHRGFRNFVDHVLDTFAKRGSDERFALVTSPSFDMTLASNWGPLLTGASLHILSEEDTRDVSRLLTFLASARITLLNVTPSHFGLLAGAIGYMDPKPELDRDMMILLGGEVINVADCNRWLELFPGHTIVNEYGPTEASVAASFFPIPVAADGRVTLDVVPIGKPIRNTSLHVLNDDRQPCMVGVPGRLYIGGIGVARGYHLKPEQTAAAFLPDWTSDEPGALIYDTGDMARVLEDGDIQFLGRRDRQVNLRGYRIELGEIEAALQGIDEVNAAVVVPQTDPRGQDILAAFYVPAEGAEADAADIRRTLTGLLPEYMVPSAIQPLAEMPTTPSGKLDIAALPVVGSGERPELAGRYVAPRSPVERHLEQVWCEVLGLETIGVEDSFWDVGGDSIRAIRLIRAVNDAGYKISLQTMFDAPTIAEMAQVVVESRSDQMSVPLVRLQNADRPSARMICLPYAGGSPILFRGMVESLDPDIAVDCAEYPGIQGGEPVGDVRALARAIFETLVQEDSNGVGGLPVILFGYCFGAYVAHEVARLCRVGGLRLDLVILSGATPPGAQHIAYDKRALLGRLDEPETRQTLDRIYAPLLRHMTEPERERYWALYRASVEGMGQYRFGEGKLAVPCAVVTGADEEYPLIHEYNSTWAEHYQSCVFHTVPGGHMMVQTHPGDIAATTRMLIESLDVAA